MPRSATTALPVTTGFVAGARHLPRKGSVPRRRRPYKCRWSMRWWICKMLQNYSAAFPTRSGLDIDPRIAQRHALSR